MNLIEGQRHLLCNLGNFGNLEKLNILQKLRAHQVKMQKFAGLSEKKIK